MKILHIASADLWGGAEAQLSSLCRACLGLGVEVHAVLLNRDSELGRRLRQDGIAVLELDEATMSALALLRHIVEYARKVSPDVIHTHRFKENIIGGFAARLAGAAGIRTVHGGVEPELLKRTMRRRVLDAVDAFVARVLQAHVVAVSDELASRLRPTLPGANMAVIANGVDVEQLQQEASRSDPPFVNPPGRFAIGYFGRLVPVKRLDLLLLGFRELKDRMRVPAELFVVGEGPEQAGLQKLAADLALTDSVHFVGFQTNAPCWISAMDCIVLTSDHEGLPMIVLEALALGVPIAARAVGGIPDVLREIDPTWLMEDGSPTSIACVLASVLEKHSRESRGASLLPARYSALSMAGSYLDLYRALGAKHSLQLPTLGR